LIESPSTLARLAVTFHTTFAGCDKEYSVAQIAFDLATRVVAKNQTIWAVFPGKHRRFVDTFREASAIFLDFPSLELSQRVLANDDLLRQHIAMSEAWAAYRRGYRRDPPNRMLHPTKLSGARL
jgi:hypothetical protein